MLPHVLWIGGPSGSGKTTIAHLLARRHGLRWYNSDAHTWKHRDRALAAGHPAAHRWEEWRGLEPRPVLSHSETYALSLHEERGPMTVDDLRALPASPLIVAEGTQVTPLVTDGSDTAVFLIPPSAVRRARLEERPYSAQAIEYSLHQGLELERLVDSSGARKLVPTPEQNIEDVLREVEQIFEKPLAEGPLASTRAERQALARYSNRIIVEQVLAFHARPWSPHSPETVVKAFDCECGREGCLAQVELPVTSFPTDPLLAH